jgi:hypothetical protein
MALLHMTRLRKVGDLPIPQKWDENGTLVVRVMPEAKNWDEGLRQTGRRQPVIFQPVGSCYFSNSPDSFSVLAL